MRLETQLSSFFKLKSVSSPNGWSIKLANVTQVHPNGSKTRKQSKRSPHLSFYRQTYDFEGRAVVFEHLEMAIVLEKKKKKRVSEQSATICCIFQGSIVIIIPRGKILFSDVRVLLFSLVCSPD